MEVTVRYTQDNEILEVRNGTTWSIDTDEGNARQIPDVTPPWYGAELSKRIEGGVLYVDLYSDIEDPEKQQVDSGGDGTRDVQVGTMILGAGVTLSAGSGITGQRGTLDGEPGTFNCTGSGGCRVANGITTRGMWKFTPDRPPSAVDVSSSDTVAWNRSVQ